MDTTTKARGSPPTLVAFFRGLVEAILLAIIAIIIDFLTSADIRDLAPYSPIALLLLRQAEGIVDQRIDPTVQRGVLGGAPVNGYATSSDPEDAGSGGPAGRYRDDRMRR